MQSVVGIMPHPEARGMDRVIIRPRPPTKLDAASGSFDTPRGTIVTAWGKTPTFYLNVTIPPNVLAEVYIPKPVPPAGGAGGATVLLEHGNVMREVDGGVGGRGPVHMQLQSGHYSFSFADVSVHMQR